MNLSSFNRLVKNPANVAVFAAIVCFLAYTCISTYRKAFNVAPYSGFRLWGLDYKVVLVITQIFGYMLSKFYGIRFIAEMKRIGRGKLILFLVGISWLAWLLFAVIPAPFNFFCLFFNGFPLGMVWGVVFSFVEGRRATDFIGSALAVSFIFGPGLAKSTGQYVMKVLHVSEYWMPFVTGLIFLLPLLFFVYLLEKIPLPDKNDIDHRAERVPMFKERRKELVRYFLPGIIVFVLIYILVTILREVRDGFMADMWRESGETMNPNVFAKTETLIALVILVIIALMVFVKNNYRALMLTQFIMLAGFLVSGVATLLFLDQQLSMFNWMTFIGLGLYMTYVPFNSLLFDRFLATFRFAGNTGFLIYIADSFGYLGIVAVLLSKEIFKIQLNWTGFYSEAVIAFSIIGITGTIVSLLYFKRKYLLNKKSKGF